MAESNCNKFAHDKRHVENRCLSNKKERGAAVGLVEAGFSI